MRNSDGCMHGCGLVFMVVLWGAFAVFAVMILPSMFNAPCLERAPGIGNCIRVEPTAAARDLQRYDALKPLDDALMRGICDLDTAKNGRGNEANPECR